MNIHKERPCHTSNYHKGRNAKVKYLVIHYVGALGDAAANARYYGSTPNVRASAHYFVGHGPVPEIWASVPEEDTAWHVGANKYVHPDCRNDNSIGIEICCHKGADDVWYFDPETLDAAVELCQDIVRRYSITNDRVLRHYDVTGKICPAPFVHDAGEWETFKHRIWTLTQKDLPAGWAAAAWDKAKDSKILDGTRPTDPVTRQELAVVLERIGLLN